MEMQTLQIPNKINPLEAAVLSLLNPLKELEDTGKYTRCNYCDAFIPIDTAFYKDGKPYCDRFCPLGIE